MYPALMRAAVAAALSSADQKEPTGSREDVHGQLDVTSDLVFSGGRSSEPIQPVITVRKSCGA
jgi:hypothetical protein